MMADNPSSTNIDRQAMFRQPLAVTSYMQGDLKQTIHLALWDTATVWAYISVKYKLLVTDWLDKTFLYVNEHYHPKTVSPPVVEI